MTDETLLAAYSTTEWEVELPHGRVTITLDTAAPEILRPAGIITGYNPGSVLCDPEENRAANQALHEELVASGARVYPTAAGEGKWHEPGFAVVGIKRAVLVRLGERWRQNAIVWFDAWGRASLVATRSGFCGWEVGEFIV